MSRLTVDVRKRLHTFTLDVRLEVADEVLVLFGPSGAGKTTILNAVAGLVTPDEGEIRLGDELFFRRRRGERPVNLPPRRRRVGYVFQDYALFPHMTVLENVAYPLWRRPDARRRALELLVNMRIDHLADRYPHEISGGQQQRVAIARALAAQPRVLLLDEPLSALDLAARERLQRDVRRLQRELSLPVIYVTHRLEDAFAVGHRLAVIREGRVEQVGPIEEVFRRPASREAAEIMGIRNLFHARVVEVRPDALVLDWDGLLLEATPQPAPDTSVTAYIRPEDVKVLYPNRPLTDAVRHNCVEGVIVECRQQSAFRELHVRLPNGHEVEVRFPHYTYTPLDLSEGQPVQLSLRKEALVVLSPQGAKQPIGVQETTNSEFRG